MLLDRHMFIGPSNDAAYCPFQIALALVVFKHAVAVGTFIQHKLAADVRAFHSETPVPQTKVAQMVAVLIIGFPLLRTGFAA